MPSSDLRAVCVSIHDVAPSTWDACKRLIDGIYEIADIPLTLLVVPNYHRLGESPSDTYSEQLQWHVDKGNELALHGYIHLDEEPMSLASRFSRTVRTRREGEFAVVSEARARLLLNRGIDWFERRNWPLSGFVAPAWLLSAGTWRALASFPFSYTTTLNRFFVMPKYRSVFSPSLTLSSRGAWLNRAAMARNHFLKQALEKAALTRLSLHPLDAKTEALRHWQSVLRELLATRTAMTKSEFARQFTNCSHLSFENPASGN